MKLFKTLMTLTAMAVATSSFAETNPLTQIKNTVAQGVETPKQALTSVKESVKSAVTEKATAVKQSAKTQMAETKQAVTSAKGSAKSTVDEKTASLKKAVKEPKGANTAKVPAKKMAKVNLNTADVNTLQMLSGIGETKAKAIVEYRNQHGKFKNINELLGVSGIGEATIEKLKGAVSF